MKSRRFFQTITAKAGFTLIEMIGVLAILSIMAAVLTPNVLHSIERAAVTAEADNLHTLGLEIGYYVRDNNGSWPINSAFTPNWTTQLATYSSLSAAEILTNRRGMTRLYVPDPNYLITHRALLISSMRNGVLLPNVGAITANFQGIWDAPDGTVPPGAGWGGWNAAAGGNIEYLVIERVSLALIYQNDLQQYTMRLNNSTATPVSYKTIPAVGAPSGVIVIPGNAFGVPVNLQPRDRLNLYSDSSGTMLNFVYVVSNTPKTFTFTTSWVAQ
ncbi:MAG: type II secretion system protein [Lacunisphaera sp.]